MARGWCRGEWLRRRARTADLMSLSAWQAVAIGTSQAIALLPGFSRSGAAQPSPPGVIGHVAEGQQAVNGATASRARIVLARLLPTAWRYRYGAPVGRLCRT
jgi:hypothetical protein